MKKCNGSCGQLKEDDEFYIKRYRNGTVGLRSACIQCGTIARDAWRKSNPHDNERNKQYNREHAHIIRGNKLKQYWPGADWKEANAKFDALLAAQNGVCAICARRETRTHPSAGKVWDLAVDHCHVTNTVRGLLCNACNRGLGLLKDSIEGLERAVAYLKKAA